MKLTKKKYVFNKIILKIIKYLNKYYKLEESKNNSEVYDISQSPAKVIKIKLNI